MSMESGGDTVDGKEVEDFQKNYDSSWSNLPPPVFSRLCAKMSKSFLHTARQVCPNWLANTENEIGLRVKIDDTITGNMDFVQSVKVVQARIVSWRGSDSSSSLGENPTLMFPNCLRKLTLTGTLPASWTVRNLQQFPNLSHLVLRGAALHTQDFTGSPLPSPPASYSFGAHHDPTYDLYEPPIEACPIWLNKLSKLEIIMNEFSYPAVLPLSIRLNEPERAIEHEAFLKRLYLVVLNNATFVLNNIRSPQLHAAQFYIYPKAGTIPPAKLNWKHKPLQRFLSNHKPVLKELYLPDFEGKHDNTGNDVLPLPTHLRKLQISLSQFIGDREESREQDTNYWKQFLMEQSQLVDFYLILTDLSFEWTRESLSSLAFSSKETLTYADIVIDQAEETVQINMEIFSFCHKLKVLKLSGRDSEIVIRNFCKLPSSLRKLYVSMANVEMPEVDLLHKYSRLEMIELKTIAIMGGAGHHPNRQSRTLEMIQEFLKLRQISLLSLAFDSPLNAIPGVVSLLHEVDPYFDPSYPTFTVKLNLTYEMEAGWSEETFDEERLEIEYINSREPEEYSNWSSRHRNAISVDEDDHRIFIFQTLPFLLDVRGRRHAAADDDWDDQPLIDEADEPDSDDDDDQPLIDEADEPDSDDDSRASTIAAVDADDSGTSML